VAIYLPKNPDAVVLTFSVSLTGAIFVPINPTLRENQIKYILDDCSPSLVITNEYFDRNISEFCKDNLKLNILHIDKIFKNINQSYNKSDEIKEPEDLAAIFYTSGSTGMPKGVLISHKNFIDGATIVADYLNLSSNDKILAILPLSFDYGFNQITSAFYIGASVILSEYLLPKILIDQMIKYKVTGLAAVPHIWNQLCGKNWPDSIHNTLRFITNSGASMNLESIKNFRKQLPSTKIFLMYGFTEAFRTTYLDPDMIDTHPNSIGKPIQNVKVSIINEHGEECKPYEIGELVHYGALVTSGYWNKPKETEIKFRPIFQDKKNIKSAAWSGDLVYKDKDGFIFFMERKDDMIKTSGYRVSPSEIEKAAYELKNVNQAVAFGVPHLSLGQGIILLVTGNCSSIEIHEYCLKKLPNYMVPKHIKICDFLPTNQNGKIDRKGLLDEYKNYFQKIC
tara:strand:- start:96 stop:1451 length:1356 start_codon:yes stop_codon:yes gene_type:complete